MGPGLKSVLGYWQNQNYTAMDITHSSPPHKFMLSLINCKIMVQFLKLSSFVSFTFATASSKALFASSNAFSVYPHLSYKKTDMLRCRLMRT